MSRCYEGKVRDLCSMILVIEISLGKGDVCFRSLLKKGKRQLKIKKMSLLNVKRLYMTILLCDHNTLTFHCAISMSPWQRRWRWLLCSRVWEKVAFPFRGKCIPRLISILRHLTLLTLDTAHIMYRSSNRRPNLVIEYGINSAAHAGCTFFG